MHSDLFRDSASSNDSEERQKRKPTGAIAKALNKEHEERSGGHSTTAAGPRKASLDKPVHVPLKAAATPSTEHNADKEKVTT